MLAELNVKDIALIRSAGVEFGPHLNILTGETGAGKSVIIGSALLSLGGKARSDMIREGAASAYTELVFHVDDAEKLSALGALGVEIPDDHTFVFSRKISDGRSISRINGETVSLGLLRDAAGLLIDIYGQNEYHSLFEAKKHLEILDSFIGQASAEERKAVRAAYEDYLVKKEYFGQFCLDERERNRELSLAAYEIDEIDRAAVRDGEEEELSELYRKLNNSRNLEECLSDAYRRLSETDLSRVISSVSDAMRYDGSLSQFRSELLDAQSILEDAQAGIREYVSELDLSGETLEETEKRLDLIRNLEAKYGRTPEDIRNYRERKAIRVEELERYEENREKAGREFEEAGRHLRQVCAVLSGVRKKASESLCGQIRRELLDLGFDAVKIRLDFAEKEPSADGMDTVCFMVALNPGEKEKPINQIASGGELSRIMLSIKTVLAKTDDIPTLIFDEIDAGISGRTAQKVAEKLDLIARNHQVICITHLPQIASMADTHFLISKQETDGRNVTLIRRLAEKDSEEELARLLGGAKMTDTVRSNAAEMKALAEEIKKEHRNEKK